MPQFRKYTKRNSVKKLSKKVNKLINSQELKQLVKVVSLTSIAGNDTGYSLNGIARGNAVGQRLGNKIFMRKLKIKIRTKLNITAYIGDDSTAASWSLSYLDGSMRAIIFLDRQNNGDTGIAISELLSSVASQEDKISSDYNYDYVDNGRDKKRYRILFDKVVYMSQNLKQDVIWKRQFTLNHKVNFNQSNAGTGADIINNDLRLLFIPMNGNLDIAFNSTCFFTDD